MIISPLSSLFASLKENRFNLATLGFLGKVQPYWTKVKNILSQTEVAPRKRIITIILLFYLF